MGGITNADVITEQIAKLIVFKSIVRSSNGSGMKKEEQSIEFPAFEDIELRTSTKDEDSSRSNTDKLL